MRRALLCLGILSAAGFYLSLELIYIHIDAHFGGGGDVGLCNALPGFSCMAVATSGFSEIFGLPIAALGAAFYLTFLLAAAIRRFAETRLAALSDVLLAGGLAAVGYSVFLAVVSVGIIKKTCPFCMGLYFVNLAIAVTALVGHPAPWREALAKLPARVPRMLGSSGFWMTAGMMAIATVGLQGVYVHMARGARLAQINRATHTMDAAERESVDTTGAPGFGPKDAPVVVVEFSDFQCPFCGRLGQDLHRAAEVAGNVRVHFRHFPIDAACNPTIRQKFHEFACLAARASICADQLGKFWPMHDLLFENNKALARPALRGYAARLGLDPEAFDACIDAPETMTAVKSDIDQAIKLKISGTPTWFVNGVRYVGAKPFDQLLAIFQHAAESN